MSSFSDYINCIFIFLWKIIIKIIQLKISYFQILNHENTFNINKIESLFTYDSKFNIELPMNLNQIKDQSLSFNLSRAYSNKDLTNYQEHSGEKNSNNKYTENIQSRKQKLDEILQSINSFKKSQTQSPKNLNQFFRASEKNLRIKNSEGQSSFIIEQKTNYQNSFYLVRNKSKNYLNQKNDLSRQVINQSLQFNLDERNHLYPKKSLKRLKQQDKLLYSTEVGVNNTENKIIQTQEANIKKNQTQVSTKQNQKSHVKSKGVAFQQKQSVQAIKQKLLKYGIHLNQNKNLSKKLNPPPNLTRISSKRDSLCENINQKQTQMMTSVKSQGQKYGFNLQNRPLTSLKQSSTDFVCGVNEFPKNKIQSVSPTKNIQKKQTKNKLNDSNSTYQRISPMKSVKSLNSITSNKTHIQNFNLNMQNFTNNSFNFGPKVASNKKPGSYGNQKNKTQHIKEYGSNSKLKPGSYGNSNNSKKQLFQPSSSFSKNSSILYKPQLKQTIQTNCTQNINFKKLQIQDFTIGKGIGKGKFGKVFLCIHNQTGFLCALKIIKKQTVRKQRNLQQLTRQIKIQSYLNQCNNVKMYGYFDYQHNIYLLIEYCMEGQLYSLLKLKKRFEEDQAIPIIKDVCEGLNHLHSQNIIHRDVKPENVVMSLKMAKLCDFGWSVNTHNQKRQTFCGTPLYVSPQLLMGKTYDYKVDVWALGVMVYQLLTGRLPFHITTQKQLKKIVTTQVLYPQYLSQNAKNFIQHLLQKNPSYRNSLDSILQHKFLVQGLQRIRSKTKIV